MAAMAPATVTIALEAIANELLLTNYELRITNYTRQRRKRRRQARQDGGRDACAPVERLECDGWWGGRGARVISRRYLGAHLASISFSFRISSVL